MDASEEKEFSLVCTLTSDLCTGSHLVLRDILQTPCLQPKLLHQESCQGLCSPSSSWWCRKPDQTLQQCVPAVSFLLYLPVSHPFKAVVFEQCRDFVSIIVV